MSFTYIINDIHVAVSDNNILSALEGIWLAHVGSVADGAKERSERLGATAATDEASFAFCRGI